MKKILLSLMAIMTITTISAKSIWTEHFNHNVGDLTTLTTQDDLSYLDYTNWYYNASGTNAHMQVADTNLTYPNYCTKATGKAVKISAKSYKTGRQFADITTGSVYVSALVKINTLQGSDDTKEYFLCMTPDIAGSSAFARLYTKKSSDGYQLGIAKFAEASGYLRYSQKLNYGKTYLLVMKYEFADGEKNDFVSLYINPTAETAQPTVTCVRDTTTATGAQQGSDSKNDAASIAGVVINQAANTSRDMFIDEIKVATAWADLWESGSDVKEPSITLNADNHDFGEIVQNSEAQTWTFTVTGANLTDDITLSKTHDDVALSISSISKSDAANKDVVITITPNTLGEQTETITLASGTLVKTVTLSWKVIEYVDPKPLSNLIANGGFEQFETTTRPPFGLITTYNGWDGILSGLTTEATDIKEGTNALRTSELGTTSTLFQSIDMTGFDVDDEFELTLWYKVLTSKGEDLTLQSFWSQYQGVDISQGLTQDADKLQKVLPSSDEWTSYIIRTTKPANGNRFEFRLKLLKGAEVLLDDFKLMWQSPATDVVTPAISTKATKVLKDGQLIIIDNNGKCYNVLGF